MLSLINNPLSFIIMLGAFLVAITIHECAHAWMADRFGDPTARLMGRISLNPMAHLDLFGTLMILFAPFGWAKPVQVDPFNLRNPRRDSAIISLSGPAANLLLAIACSLLLQVLSYFLLSNSFISLFVFSFIRFMIVMNVNLAIFNLIPIHPLDGFAVVEGLLPEDKAREWHQLQPYGMIFLLFLVFPIFGTHAPLTNIINPIINVLLNLLLPGNGYI